MLILTLILLSYTAFILFLTFIVLFKSSTHSSSPAVTMNKPVSVVIPFRNEQKHLKTLLKSLTNQDYDSKIEILLINDDSTDGSVKEIEKYLESNSIKSNISVSVLDTQFDHTRNLSSKQQALDLGISTARFEWIAMTDADMKLNPNWLSILMEKSSDDIGLVFGHTSIIGDNSIFYWFQKFQLEFLFAVAYAFFNAGLSGSCMGNNMLLSKQAYQKSGGFNAVGYTIVEDRGLFNQFLKKKLSVSCTMPFSPSAYTFPCKSWKQFYHQIRRWAHGGLNWKSNLLPVGMLTFFQNCLLLIAITPFLPLTLRIITLLNFLLTWLFTSFTFNKIHSPQNALYYPLFYLFFLIESLLFLYSIIFKVKIEWKGRTIK